MSVIQRSMLMQQKFSTRGLIKPATFILCALPLIVAIYAVSQDQLGANPVEGLLLLTGEWGLRFLLITLAVTPLQFMFKWLWVAKLRRMLGLFAFFYAVMHMLIWLVLDQGLDWSSVLNEILEKKYIAVGVIALLGLLPLALTSNRWAIRKLGKKWKPLHRLVYPLTLLVVVHFLWQVRANDIIEPVMYLAVLMGLLCWRFYRVLK